MAGFLGTPIVQYFDNNGEFLSGGKAYFYFPGTENFILVYGSIQDSVDQINPLDNPVILDEYGRASIVTTGLFKIKLTDADDNVIWTVDNLGSIQGDVYDEFDNLILSYTEGGGGNFITFQNNIKNAPAIIRADGVDGDVDILLEGKGTGQILIRSGIDTYEWPAADGTAGDIIKTDGNGALFWGEEGGIAGGYVHPPGLIDTYALATPPSGYLLCDGAEVSRTTYANLFTAIGTTYGTGDGSTTFNLPNCTRRAIVQRGGTGTATLGNALGNTGGEETHVLTTPEIPSHSHSYVNAVGAVVGWGPSLNPVSIFTMSKSNTNTSAAGDDEAHNNIQPSIVMYYIIKT